MAKLPLTVRVVAVGKLRGSSFAAAAQDYLERLRHFLDVEMIEVKDRVGKGKSDPQAIVEEGQALLKATHGSPRIVALALQGEEYTSEDFARLLQSFVESGVRRVDFVVGGPVGLADEVMKAAHLRLALSTMTLPHELARVVLLEQIYRGCTILAGTKYHK